MIRNQREEIKDYVQTTKISNDIWTDYFEQLYRATKNNIVITKNEPHIIVDVTDMEISTAMKRLKNRKSGEDGIFNELFKYGGESLQSQLTSLIKNIFQTVRIPKNWKFTITIPIFKKGEKQIPSIYRGIHLLNTDLKLTTSVIMRKLNEIIDLQDKAGIPQE